MRVVVLTTGSLRRRYFVQALAADVPVCRVFAATNTVQPPFETAHAIDAESKADESAVWFGGRPPAFADVAEVEEFPSLNDAAAVAAMAAQRPDVMIVFGTEKLGAAVRGLCPAGCVNLHGGDPEEYRGLDSHLWAVHHGDFHALRVTLHRVAAGLDTGDVISSLAVPLSPGMGLHELRRARTEVSVRLTADALLDFAASGHFAARPQKRRGRYFSYMPADLKTSCVTRFARHTAGL